jgi:hypothetical protein
MWDARRLGGVFVLALALACASAVQGADESAPVPRPDVKVGEWWRYRITDYPTNVPRVRNGEARVTFVGPNEILVVHPNNRESIFTADWGGLSLDGPGVAYDKPRHLLAIPLKVGSSHRVAYEVESRRGSGTRSRFDETIKVVRWEEVVVPAGTFRALKLESEGTYQRLDTRGGGWLRREIWYVPEVKRWVKWTYGEGRGAPTSQYQRNTDELIAYKVQ